MSVLLAIASYAADAPKAQTLAVFVNPGASVETAADLEAALPAELGLLPDVALVERAALERILKEQKLTLSGLVDARSAAKVGQLAGADLLLFIEPQAGKVSLRLVEVNSGKVLMEEATPVQSDPFLTAAAIREKVYAVLHPDRSVRRLTVGIAAFVNKSGTDRSDKLNVELQNTLRERLRKEPWAIVLERQYPTGLLEEKDLARLGLSKGSPENLPPADIVVMGSIEDIGAVFDANKPWETKADVMFRTQRGMTQFAIRLRSDRLAATADAVVDKLNETVNEDQPGAGPASEIDYWRNQALYLMPRSSYQVGRSPFDCISDREKKDAQEAIRAWEDLLLLDADNADAKLNLGMCLLSLHHNELTWGKGERKQLAARESLRGTYLVDAAFQADPNSHTASTFYFAALHIQTQLPDRAGEMYQYIVDHPGQFQNIVRSARTLLISLRKDMVFQELEESVRNADSRPEEVTTRFAQVRNASSSAPDASIAQLARYADSPIPLVKFEAQRSMADILWRRKKDRSAIAHFDRAIEVLEEAVNSRTQRRLSADVLDDIYREKMVCCEALGIQEEMRATAFRGAEHFKKVNRFSSAAEFVLYYCATESLHDGDAARGVDVCDTYLRLIGQDRHMHSQYKNSRMLGLKLLFQAKLSGVELPDWGGMTLVASTQATDVYAPSLAVAGGKVWIAWQPWQAGGTALVYAPGMARAEVIKDIPDKMRTVAAIGDRVFFGGQGGLYEVDVQGRIVRHYRKQQNELPSDHIVSLCEGDGALYMSFRESDRYGVAKLDPKSVAIAILAPTSRQATFQTEPVIDVYRVWWDDCNKRVVANSYFVYESERNHEVHCWTQNETGWTRLWAKDLPPRAVISSGGETLRMTTVGKDTRFEFLETKSTLECTIPLPELVGEPAWDDRRIWVPAYLGLYEVDRKSGDLRWIAWQDGTQALSALKLGGRLYVATTKGLFWCPVPK